VTVTVNGPTRLPSCSLALVTGAFVRLNSIHDAANATILVQDQYGNPVRRALVYVSTSGLVSMKRTALRTDDLGRVNVSTPGFRRGTRGSVVFTVATVESPGRPFVNVTVAPVTVATFAGVFGIGQGAHITVAHLIPLGQCGGQFIILKLRIKLLQVKIFGACRFVCHLPVLPALALAPFGNHAAHQLGRIVNDGNNPAIVKPGWADDAHGANDLTVGVHIGRNDQSGTRK